MPGAAPFEALRELEVVGVPTTAPLAAAVLAHDDFRDVRHTTHWLSDHAATLATATGPAREVEVLGRWYRVPRFADTDGDGSGGSDVVMTTGAGPARPRATTTSTVGLHAGTGLVTAPMQGTVTKIEVSVGDRVTADTRVIAMEAMKMENALLAGIDGVVTAIHVTVGANVAAGTLLVEVEA